MKEKINFILNEAIEELNEQLEEDKQLVCEPSERLIGSKGKLDSLAFVTLVSIIEDRLFDDLGLSIQLVSDKAFSKERSPFYSVGSLCDFIEELIAEE
jgi:acyl carrier protein